MRDKAIMELFYSSGLRLDELVGLDIAQLDLADRTVRVLGKGRKTRIVPVGRKAVDALRAWLRERAALAGVGRDRAVRRPEWLAAEASRRAAAHRVLGAAQGPAEPRASAPFPPFVRHASA